MITDRLNPFWIRVIRHCLVVWYVVMAVGQVYAQQVILNPETEQIHLGPYASYCEDNDGILEPVDLLSSDHKWKWTKVDSNALNLGYTDSIVWVKLAFENQASKPQEFLIEIAYPVLDQINVAIVGQHGTKTLILGDKQPFYDRPIEHRNFIFPVRFDAHESLVVLMRFQTTSSMQIPLNLYRERTLFLKNQVEVMGFGLYYGSMVIMILYNLFIFLSIKEISYLYYVLYVTSMTTFLTSLNGTSFQYLWPESLWWNDQVLVVSLSGAVLFGVLFTMGFLKLKEFKPLSHKLFRSIAILAALIMVFSPLFPYKIGIKSLILITVIAIFSCMIMGVVRWLEGFKSARFYTIAWFSMLSGGVFLAMSKFNLLPRNLFTEYSLQYGSVLEVMLLSFALADRLNIEKKERIEAQNIAHQQERNARIANERAFQNERKAREAREHAFEVQKKATETLENHVRDRTYELNQSLVKVRDANSQIMSSLRYARMIQLSMLPDSQKVISHFPRHFIWWMPRDIVGGDFYYMDKIGTRSIVAVADCTGHGVPGAFMTIIANSELKRIIKGEKCFDPGDILARLNMRVRKALKQDTTHALSDDGLDIGICVHDSDTGTLAYSGARMKLLYSCGEDLFVLSGDKHSVGYISSDLDYTYQVHTVDTKDNMTFYLFTDGITDQLGEGKRIRFGLKRLKSMILDHAHLSLGDQCHCFKKALDGYRGEKEQIDDITMVAFNPNQNERHTMA